MIFAELEFTMYKLDSERQQRWWNITCMRSHENISSRLDFSGALGLQDWRSTRFCDLEDHLCIASSNDRTLSCGGVRSPSLSTWQFLKYCSCWSGSLSRKPGCRSLRARDSKSWPLGP